MIMGDLFITLVTVTNGTELAVLDIEMYSPGNVNIGTMCFNK